MPTVEELLNEMGIDPKTVKPEVSQKWNGYFTDAESKLNQAQTLNAQIEQQKAEILEQRSAIDEAIASGYASDQQITAMKAQLAAAQAQLNGTRAYLKELKDNNWEIPEDLLKEPAAAVQGSPAVGGNAAPAFDERGFYGRVGNIMADYLDGNNEYQRLTGQPLPDKAADLANEAAKAKMSVSQYIAKKYDFAGIKKKKDDEAFQARVDAEVKKRDEARQQKWNETHTGANPFMQSGVDSKFSQVKKANDPKSVSEYSSLPTGQKLQRSIEKARSIAAGSVNQ